ncbi:MAG: hypothetical protein AAFP03_09485, partial [Cyanobacteria bacterium J06598_3]
MANEDARVGSTFGQGGDSPTGAIAAPPVDGGVTAAGGSVRVTSADSGSANDGDMPPRERLTIRTSHRKSLAPRKFWQMAEPISPKLDWWLRILSVIIPFALWWVASNSGAVNPKFLPSPVDVV